MYIALCYITLRAGASNQYFRSFFRYTYAAVHYCRLFQTVVITIITDYDDDDDDDDDDFVVIMLSYYN